MSLCNIVATGVQHLICNVTRFGSLILPGGTLQPVFPQLVQHCIETMSFIPAISGENETPQPCRDRNANIGFESYSNVVVHTSFGPFLKRVQPGTGLASFSRLGRAD